MYNLDSIARPGSTIVVKHWTASQYVVVIIEQSLYNSWQKDYHNVGPTHKLYSDAIKQAEQMSAETGMPFNTGV